LSIRTKALAAIIAAVAFGASGGLIPFDSNSPAVAGPGLEPPPGNENSSVLLFNAGAESASVVLSYYGKDGNYLTGDACPGDTGGAVSCTAELGPGQSFRFDQFYNEALGSDYRGSGTLASDQPLETLVIKNVEDTSRGTPSFLSYSIENAPSASYLRLGLPYVPFRAGGWTSRFTVQNTSDRDAACIVITYRDNRGRRIVSPKPSIKPNEGRCPKGGWAVLPLGTLV
jgi:hypothetical protein